MDIFTAASQEIAATPIAALGGFASVLSFALAAVITIRVPNGSAPKDDRSALSTRYLLPILCALLTLSIDIGFSLLGSAAVSWNALIGLGLSIVLAGLAIVTTSAFVGSIIAPWVNGAIVFHEVDVGRRDQPRKENREYIGGVESHRFFEWTAWLVVGVAAVSYYSIVGGSMATDVARICDNQSSCSDPRVFLIAVLLIGSLFGGPFIFPGAHKLAEFIVIAQLQSRVKDIAAKPPRKLPRRKVAGTKTAPK